MDVSGVSKSEIEDDAEQGSSEETLKGVNNVSTNRSLVLSTLLGCVCEQNSVIYKVWM